MNTTAEILRHERSNPLVLYPITAFNRVITLPLNPDGPAKKYLSRISELKKEAKSIQNMYRQSPLDEPGSIPAVPDSIESRFEKIYPEIRAEEMQMTTAVLHEQLQDPTRQFHFAAHLVTDLALTFYRHFDVSTIMQQLGEKYQMWFEDTRMVYALKRNTTDNTLLPILHMLNKHQRYADKRQAKERRQLEQRRTDQIPYVPTQVAPPMVGLLANAGAD